MQLHAVMLAMFASIIAPFGGFFASGFKRGFKIKDFGDSIPGHGGMTDRMDCQVVMAVFSYIYVKNWAFNSGPTASSLRHINDLRLPGKVKMMVKRQLKSNQMLQLT
ncbi:hypothetical protein WJX84_009664 [Apatococcus fuscideae]|uniref:Phosphatidate cytidylyltransferase n=1 Tax=Apatococcus fuscideae TaxID=2026836 RepID=A0AAW1SQ44_9CHLO